MKQKLIIGAVIIWVLSLLTAYFAMRYGLDQRDQRIVAENNLHASEQRFITESGKHALKVSELQSTIKELRSASRKDSALRNDYERSLTHANSVIKDLNIRLRNVESTNNVGLSSSRVDTVYLRIDSIQKVHISPIKTPYFEAVFKPVNDSIIAVSHSYHSSVDIVISRERGRKLDGDSRFIICRWISPKWQYSATLLAEDPDAMLTSNYIRFKKR